MKTIIHITTALVLALCLLSVPYARGQRTNVSFPVSQQDHRLSIGLEYQASDNAVLGALSQDYRITVRNKTQDKLHVYIEYYVDLVCGSRKTHQLGPLRDGYVLQPGESIAKNWSNDGINSYGRLLENSCPKNTWKTVGADEQGNTTYSLINSLGYRIVKIINISEQERQEAEEKKRKEEAEKRRKEEERKKKEEEDRKQQEEAEKKRREQETERQRKENEEKEQEKVFSEEQLRAQERAKAQENERAKREQTAREDAKVEVCQRSYMIQTAMRLESSYASYKNGNMPLGSRDQLMDEARQFLFLCPYNVRVQQILNELEREVQIQTEMISGIIENSIKYEIEFNRSLLASDDHEMAELHIGNEFSGLTKFYFGAHEMSFILAFGLSQERYPVYEFTYSDASGLPNDFPKQGKPFDVGSRFSIDAGLGLGSVIPLIKNPGSEIPALGLVLEGLGFLKWGTSTNMITKSHFPDLWDDFGWALRGRSGLLIACGKNFGLAFNFGLEKFFMKSEVESTIQRLTGANGGAAYVKYKAKALNTKSLIPFIGLSVVFGK